MSTKTAKKSKKSTPAAKPAAATLRPEVLRLAKFLMERTEPIAKQLSLTEDKPLSEKAKALRDYIQKNMGGGYGVQAAELFSILLGENITPSTIQIPDEVLKGALVIATGNDNNHNYPLDTILVVGDHGISHLHIPTQGWGYGNRLTQTKEHLRVPTEQEILDFVDANFDRLSSTLGVVIL